MKTRLVLYALFALACVGCQRNMVGNTWNILSPRESSDWMPTKEQVLAGRDAAKQKTQAALVDPSKSAETRDVLGKILAQWDRYRVQASGKTSSDGKKVIELFFLIPNNDANWKRDQRFEVDDGGYNYWHVTYDPATRTAYDAYTNPSVP